MQAVRIKSFDMSFSSGTWHKDSVKDFGLVYLDIIGWLVEEREDCIVIASEYQSDGQQFRHLMAIPKVCIMEIRKYRKS